MQSGLERLEEGETGRAAAFINREIDGDVSSSAAGSAGKKKERSSREERGVGRLPDASYR